MIARRILAIAAAFALSAGALAADPKFWKNEWPNTDFTQATVPWIEIMSGGPPKDGIPALSDPGFIPALDETRLGDREPVVTVEIEMIGETIPVEIAKGRYVSQIIAWCI